MATASASKGPPVNLGSAVTSSMASPVKLSGLPSQASSKREVVQASVPAENSSEIANLTVAEFWDELHYRPEDFKQKTFVTKEKPYKKENFCSYMYDISYELSETLKKSRESQIFFLDSGSIAYADHPTGSQCRPDFIAVAGDAPKNRWSDVEATIESLSSGTSFPEGLRQAMAYTYFLLQARPDRISVPGMYVDHVGVVLFITSATKIKRTERLVLAKDANIQLLYAFVKRIYEPHPLTVDPTIKIQKDSPGDSLFDITLDVPNFPEPITCYGYRIANVSPSRGQRTHIFVNQNNPTIVNGQPILVIKDQYRREGRRFDEHKIIEWIHNKGEVPGIIRIAHAQKVVRNDNSSVSSDDRIKTRMCMVDFGEPIMAIKTPKEVLMTIYDLLEVTRFIYFNRRVLHRDISEGNVMVKKQSTNVPIIENAKEKASENTAPATAENQLCFIGHLLNSNVSPRETSLLLLDFDRGEIIGENDDKTRMERTGTELFMAKAIRQGKHLGIPGTTVVYESIPEIMEQVRVAYKDAHPDRLLHFPTSDQPHFVRIPVTPDSSKIRHQLYHDAESAYWLLVRWAMLAFPAGSTPTEMASEVWTPLTGLGIDNRPFTLIDGALDQGYAALEKLLSRIAIHLGNDRFWAGVEPFSRTEFIHEAFQRVLLNFIVENQDQEFMDLPKDDNYRKCASNFADVPLPHPQVEKLRNRGSRSTSRSSSPTSPAMMDLPPSPSPPPGRQRTRSMTGDSSVPPSDRVTRSASSLRTASSTSSVRSDRSESSGGSGGSKRAREAERTESQAAESSKKAKRSQSQPQAGSTSKGKSDRKRK
ncbi:hypothetical protein BDN70DRAFT_838189 [Pholiota conissans]|uniref:Fungal-type protein kinase domain-containing protein n=1 Tax=Pholiota conissans TaxID=109636 RepID=A0A9P5YWW4_9AGAR|nr:hypothetical protein BDN70DRAFT_838189 [Pholiota conissans]